MFFWLSVGIVYIMAEFSILVELILYNLLNVSCVAMVWL